MLHIWLPSQQSNPYVWNETICSWQPHHSWQSIADDFGKASVCLYFPSRHILQVATDLTANQLKQLGETGQKYLFEDISLSSVEHLQVRKMQGFGHQYLYAISQNDIEQWLNTISLIGMDVQALLPDFLLLNTAEGTAGQAHLYHDNYTTLLRQSEASGTAVSFLPLLVEQIDLVGELIIYPSIHDETETTEVIQTLTELNISYSVGKKTPQPIIKANRHPLNFLIKTVKSNISPYLKIAMIVATTALFSQIVADGLTLRQLTQKNKATISATQKQFKSWYPEERFNSRTNLKTQIEPKLKSREQSDTSMMSLFSQVSPLIKQSAVTAKEVLISDKSIRLQLQAHDRKQLDNVINKLQQQGIEAQLGVVNNIADNTKVANTQSASGRKVTGQVTIRPANITIQN